MSDSQEPSGAMPLDELDLKGERVQRELEAAAAALQGERVQERLKRMPGWNLAVGGRAIDCSRELPSAFGAADYANFVLREAARTRQRVQIRLSGSRMVVSVLAPVHGEGSGVIGRDQLDFAASLV
jgi:hypothetical protein